MKRMNWRKLYAICVAALLLWPFCASAAVLTTVSISQTAQAEDRLFVFFDARDETGAAVTGISGADVSLSVGTKAFSPQVREAAKSGMGVGYVLAVDLSRSLSKKQFAGAKRALKDWIEGMGEGDCAALLSIGEEIAVLTDFTADRELLLELVKALEPADGKTRLYSGVLRALDVARRQGEGLPIRRAAVLLTDGVDDFPASATLGEVSQKAAEAGLPLYVVGVQGKKNRDAINDLGAVARLSGGDIVLSDGDALPQSYAKAYERIQEGYVAEIPLDGSVADGSVRGLILTVSQNGVLAEDSTDVRLRAVPPTPTPDPTPIPSPTPAPDLPAVSQMADEAWMLWAIAGGAVATLALALAAIVIARKNRKKTKKSRTAGKGARAAPASARKQRRKDPSP